MKVLQLCVNYGTPLFSVLFKYIREKSIIQTVFYPRRNIHNKQSDNFENIILHSPKILNSITRIFYFYKIRKCYFEIGRNIELAKINIIHAHTLFSDGGLAYKINVLKGIPYVISIRQTDLKFLKFKPWLKPYGLRILKNASKVICITPVLKTKIEKAFQGSSDMLKSKIQIVPNGIRNEFFADSIKGFKQINNSRKINLIYVGAFYKLKNIHKLIEFVNRNSQNYNLTIVGGGGTYENRINFLIRNSGEGINYIGRINEIEKLKFIYRQNDIFIMPSYPETFGLVYIEAMSQGLPILYARNTGIDNFFEEGKVGYSVNPNSFSEWSENIEKIINNYIEISKNCISESQKFNWTFSSTEIINIYNQSISSQKSD